MTQDDLEREIGRAHMERSTLVKKIACVERRFGATARDLVTLADNPMNAEAAKNISEATNPLEDWAELQKMRARRAELDDVLK